MRLSFHYTDAFLTVLMWTTPQTVGPKHTTIQSVMSTEIIMSCSNIIVVSTIAVQQFQHNNNLVVGSLLCKALKQTIV